MANMSSTLASGARYPVARPHARTVGCRMSIDVRPSEDADKYLATDQLVWFGEVTDADADHLRLGLPEDQRFVVDLPGRPGRPAQRHLRRTPDGDVAARRGRRPDRRPHLGRRAPRLAPPRRAGRDDDRPPRPARTTPAPAISALHASEAAIYGRYGYGMAALELPGVDSAAVRRSPRRTSRTRSPASPPTWSTMSDPGRGRADARLPARLARRLPRHDRRLARLLLALASSRPSSCATRSRRRVLFARRDGEDVGFAGLRREHKWDDARPSGTVDRRHLLRRPAAGSRWRRADASSTST